MSNIILGISAFYHDSAAALVADGKVIAAAQEERFSRTKHDPGFPAAAITYVLQEAGIGWESVNAIVFYDKPLLKFERLLVTFHAMAPKGLRAFLRAMPAWLKEKLFMKSHLRRLMGPGARKVPLYFSEHHLSHAASAFYPSPFPAAAVLTIDGVGEWATATICSGEDNRLTVLKEMHFPHSAGLLYSAFTAFLGFRVNSGEYKLMGLAAYADKNGPELRRFARLIRENLVDIREDGSILLNLTYFDFPSGLTMINNRKWESLFGLCQRVPESGIREEHVNLAGAIQEVLTEIVIALARTARAITGREYLVLAGGVALNCAANGRLAEEKIFQEIWVPPAPGDAGGAIGAALAMHFIGFGASRTAGAQDGIRGAALGPAYSDEQCLLALSRYGAVAKQYDDFQVLCVDVASELADGKIVGWFQERMEFGPRALGNRSILGDARNPHLQLILNEKIKARESFRPFAPAILEEEIAAIIRHPVPSPYMSFTGPILPALRFPGAGDNPAVTIAETVTHPRSSFPSVTHVDYSARYQTVSPGAPSRFRDLLLCFQRQTGCPMLINTSFNRRGQPIVNRPEEAYAVFIQAGLDLLVLGNVVFRREEQPPDVARLFPVTDSFFD